MDFFEDGDAVLVVLGLGDAVLVLGDAILLVLDLRDALLDWGDAVLARILLSCKGKAESVHC